MPRSSHSLEDFDLDFYADSIVEHFAGQRITKKDLNKWVKAKWPEIKWQKKLSLVMEILVNNQRATKQKLSISPHSYWYGFIKPGQAFVEFAKYHVSKEYSDSVDPTTSIGKVYAAREKLYELKSLHSKEILENATNEPKFKMALKDLNAALTRMGAANISYLPLLKNELDMAYSISVSETLIARMDIYKKRHIESLGRVLNLEKMETTLRKHGQSVLPLTRQILNLREIARWEQAIITAYQRSWSKTFSGQSKDGHIVRRGKEGLDNYELKLEITFDEDRIISQVDKSYRQCVKQYDEIKKLYQSLNSALTGAKNKQVGQLRSMVNNQELLNL